MALSAATVKRKEWQKVKKNINNSMVKIERLNFAINNDDDFPDKTDLEDVEELSFMVNSIKKYIILNQK